MKYYCIGDKISLIKVSESPNCLDNLPYFGTPMFAKMPVTQARMRNAFQYTDQMIVCKHFNDIKKLRYANLTIDNATMTAEFCQGALADGYPYSDHAIYEIEIDDRITLHFQYLPSAPLEQLQRLVSDDLYFKAALKADRTDLPPIDVCLAEKAALNPRLLACHYYSLKNNEEEITKGYSCRLL